VTISHLNVKDVDVDCNTTPHQHLPRLPNNNIKMETEKEHTAATGADPGTHLSTVHHLLSHLQKHIRRTLSTLSQYNYTPQQPSQPQPTHPEQTYLLGVRGLLTLQTFTWVFLTTFVPAAVQSPLNTTPNNTTNTPQPKHHELLLRSILSPLLWNESLIYSAYILLSARTIPLPYLHTSTRTTLASALFRRGLRLFPPLAITLAIATTAFSSAALTNSISTFTLHTSNPTLALPIPPPNALAYFNSLFNLFWTTRNPASQSASLAFPSQTLWALTVIYAQSYTVYATMLITPYTRAPFRVAAYIAFVLSAWWVQSWAWHSITGLLLADAVVNMRYAERAARGVNIWRTRWKCPTWIPCVVLMAAGLAMQYLWTDWRPQYANRELKAHTGLYYSGGLNTQVDEREPQARDDDYLLLLGFFLLLESSGFMQRIFSNSFLVYMGRRSLSEFPIAVPS